VPLDVKGRLVHIRLHLLGSKRPTEIDWIEIGPEGGNAQDQQRWDFDASTNAAPAKRPK